VENRGADNLSIDTVTVASKATKEVLNSLAIANNGALDVLNHAVQIDNITDPGTWNGSAYTGMTRLITSARSGGGWNSSGITSSIAASDNGRTTVAIAPSTADGGSILIRNTCVDDANLDRKINIDDYTRIDPGIAAQINVGLTATSITMGRSRSTTTPSSTR